MAAFSKLELTLQLTHKNICMEKMAATEVDGRMISVISMSQGRTSQGLCGLLSQKPNIHLTKAEFTNCCFCMLCIVRHSEHLPSAKKKTNPKQSSPPPPQFTVCLANSFWLQRTNEKRRVIPTI